VVAVVDTGVDYNHLDMVNQMWMNPGETGLDTNGFDKASNGLDDDGSGYVDDVYGIDVYNSDSDPMDDNLHGTHVAGTIAADTSNGYGLAGICPSAKIMAVKMFSGEGRGSSAEGIVGIRYAVDMGAKVINNSWGGSVFQQSLQDAIDYANEKGVLVVAAAGNDNSSFPFYPAAYRGVYSIAASDCQDRRAVFSNYGFHLDASAPGHDIISLLSGIVSPPYGDFDEEFLIISGTSMAAPAAAGASALLMLKRPGFEPWVYEKVMERTCSTNFYDIPDNTNYVGQLGAGRIDVYESLVYTNSTAFLSSSMDLHSGFGRSFLAPNDSTHISVEVGTWIDPITNLTVQMTAVTTGITLMETNYSIGDMAAGTTTNLPVDAFEVYVETNAPWNSIQKIKVELLSGETVMEVRTNAFLIYGGQVKDFVVADLDDDGSVEIIGTRSSVVSVFDQSGNLKWFHDLGGTRNMFMGPSVADIDNDGMMEIVVFPEVISLTSATDREVWVFEHDGTCNTNNWPVNVWSPMNMTTYGTALPPTLKDMDDDGDADIVIAGRDAGYEAWYMVLDEHATQLALTETDHVNFQTSPLAVGDINRNGSNELVSIETGEVDGIYKSRVVIRNQLLQEIRTFPMPPTTNYFAGQCCWFLLNGWPVSRMCSSDPIVATTWALVPNSPPPSVST